MTKWVEAFPLKSSDAEDAAQALFYGVVLKHGCCRSLVTDIASNFTAVMFSELCKLLEVKKIHTTAHHPEGNGVVERVNGTLVKQLALIINEEQDNWSDLLPVIIFAYHTSYHRSINRTPFEAMYGRKALLPLDLEHYTTPEARNSDVKQQLDGYQQKIKWIQEQVATSNKKAQETSKERYDRRTITKIFQPDDTVLLRIMKHKKGTCPKLSDKFMGPYTVVTQLSEVNYRIRDPKTGREQTVHVNRMKLLPERREPEEISVEQYHDMFGDSDDENEEFHGFEDDEDSLVPHPDASKTTYVTYLIGIQEC